MKKLFTLIAFLAVVMGAKAEWVEDYLIDYSTKADFPFYVMGYAPSIIDGVMVDNPVPYRKLWRGDEQDFPGESECTETTVNGGKFYLQMLESNPWRQYFIADGIPTQLDGAYKITAMVKASQAINCEITMQWNWSGGAVLGSASIGTEWQEVEWEYSGIQGQSCALIAKPGVTDAVIEWKWLKVEHNQKATRPVEWRNVLVDKNTGEYYNGVVNQLAKPLEVELAGASADEIFALVKPSSTKVEEGATVFYFQSPAVNKDAYSAASDQNSFAWANQLFITSPEKIKANETIRISFDYKADKNANTNTQAHGRPSAYHHWSAIGDVAFTTEWQHIEKTLDVTAEHAGVNQGEDIMYSIAFNLNPENCDANTWYLKNVKVEKMVLDEGFFVASANTVTGIAYDYDAATEMVDDAELEALVAVVGEKGKQDTWVNELQISTKRGQDAQFKMNTIKPAYVKNDADDWASYEAATNYKIKLPAAGVWQIAVAPEEGLINFVKLEGEEEKEPVVIVANPYEVVVNAVERDKTLAEKQADGEAPTEFESEDAKNAADAECGHPWDNQFCLMANRPIKSGEETVISFDYVAEKAAKTGTQVTSDVPGGYLFWNCIGDVNFTTEEQHLEKTYKIPFGDQNAELTTQSITFNMAIIKEANVYRIKNIIWKTSDNSESLIDMEGTKNFFIKTGANTGFYQAGTDGIEELVAKPATSKAVYNIAGQRVSNNYKGIVVKNGSKYIVK